MTLTQINKAGLDELALDHVFTIGASGSDHYTFQGEGLNGTVNDPTLYLTRGKTYRFENGTGAHPIRIQSTSGASGTAYNTGVTNNAGSGTVIVEVQHDAPDVLYYQCTSHANMNGVLYITGALADGGVTTAKLADDAVTDAKLANSINTAIAANTAKNTNATHTGDVTGSGSLTIANNAVTTAKIANDAVTRDKIADDVIASEHFIAGEVDANALASNAVTTAKIADNAITQAKINVPISNRNLIINGAMQVAQRSTSSTSSGIQTVDRFAFSRGNTSATITQAQIDIPGGFASSDPRKEGFYKSFKITNVGQSANTQGYAYIYYPIEAQHVVQSNWYFNSSSNYVTLSFWVKASVAQDYNFALFTHDGTQKEYNFVESLSANVWTKVTKTIPGDSSLTISNDNGLGMQLYWYPYIGSHYTSGSSVNQWQTHAGYTSRPDMPSTWWTTGNSTFEITGVQLEVGSTATDFEHKSYGQELQLCQRYYEENNCTWAGYTAAAQGNGSLNVTYMTPKRAAPTLSVKTAATSVQNLTSQNLQDGKIGSFVVDTRINSSGYGRFYDLLAASDAEL